MFFNLLINSFHLKYWSISTTETVIDKWCSVKCVLEAYLVNYFTLKFFFGTTFSLHLSLPRSKFFSEFFLFTDLGIFTHFDITQVNIFHGFIKLILFLQYFQREFRTTSYWLLKISRVIFYSKFCDEISKLFLYKEFHCMFTI